LSTFLDHKGMQLLSSNWTNSRWYEHNSQTVTKLINNLVEFAEKEKDRSTYSFLQWFVSQ